MDEGEETGEIIAMRQAAESKLQRLPTVQRALPGAFITMTSVPTTPRTALTASDAILKRTIQAFTGPQPHAQVTESRAVAAPRAKVDDIRD